MYTKRKIKELENGLQRDVMMFILHQVKNTKGLTNLLKKKGGMNAKWKSVLQNSHPESFPTVNEATHF